MAASRRVVPAFWWLLFVLCAICPAALRAQDFSQERAYEHLRYIAGTIGPRPLGSPQERAALEYFARKIGELGGKVEWQPVSGSGAPEGTDRLNTASFNVIGRFEGPSPRQIIIGAHIDSSTPEIAGADDDGSGVAAILESARVLAAKPHRSTLVFVAFCGEEAGLVGSKYFVEHYPLADASLMLQLDMASDEAPLILWTDAGPRQSPAWLVSASFEVGRELGLRGLDYPTVFSRLNSALNGAGSDHGPFLEKNIPAIAFVSDVRNPIHTPYDTLEYFRPDGLGRSGRLITGLIERFDRGQPEDKTGRYTLVLRCREAALYRSALARGVHRPELCRGGRLPDPPSPVPGTRLQPGRGQENKEVVAEAPGPSPSDARRRLRFVLAHRHAQGKTPSLGPTARRAYPLRVPVLHPGDLAVSPGPAEMAASEKRVFSTRSGPPSS